jgi:hypothetical protein
VKLLNHQQFEAEMRRWAVEHVPEIGKEVHKAVTRAVYEGIVQKTPVLTGRARHNWFPTNGTPSDSAVEETAGVSRTGEPVTAQEKARIATVLKKLEGLPLGAESTYVTNNLSYIQKLEDGHSPKAPPGAMVQQTIINTLDGLQISIVPKGADK